MSSSNISHVDSELPPIDERLAPPETRYEVWDGELVYVPPADPPHGTRHSKISALVEAHAAPEFIVASDLLTRTSRTRDIAPDVSVYPRARHPQTGGRQLEHLAFEVVSTQSLGKAATRAAELARRGVRRVFAIDVERSRALEWSPALATWSALAISSHIEDAALAAPLPVEALVSAAASDDAVARALLVKHNPVIEQAVARGQQAGFAEGQHTGFAKGQQTGFAEGQRAGFAEGQQAGLAEGLARGAALAVIATLETRGIALAPADRERILDQRDPATLARWTARAVACSRANELFEG